HPVRRHNLQPQLLWRDGNGAAQAEPEPFQHHHQQAKVGEQIMKRTHLRMTWTPCLLLLPMLLAAARPAAAAGASPGSARLEHVTVSSEQGVTHLKLTSDTPVQFTDFSLADPDRIVVDCVNAEGATVQPSFENDLVKGVSFAPVP